MVSPRTLLGLWDAAEKGRLVPLTLERVLYASLSVRSPVPIVSLAEIVAVSERNNRRDAITGGLLVARGAFFQILEGARQDLNRTLARIRDDHRHREMTILDRQLIDVRRFDSWAMIVAAIHPSRQFAMEEIFMLAKVEPEQAVAKMVVLFQRSGQ